MYKLYQAIEVLRLYSRTVVAVEVEVLLEEMEKEFKLLLTDAGVGYFERFLEAGEGAFGISVGVNGWCGGGV